MDKKPIVYLDFKGVGRNSISIIGTCMRIATNATWPKETITAFQNEAMSDDRQHLLDVVFECFEVKQIKTFSVAIKREKVQ